MTNYRFLKLITDLIIITLIEKIKRNEFEY